MENKVVKRISMLFLQMNGDRVGLTKVFGQMPLERLNQEQVQQLHRKLFKICGTNNFDSHTQNAYAAWKTLTPLQLIYSVAEIELQNGTSILMVV